MLKKGRREQGNRGRVLAKRKLLDHHYIIF